MQDLDFEIMFEDEVVAKVIVKDNKLALIETYTDVTYKQVFLFRPIKLEHIESFLERRAISKDKKDLEETLNRIGLKEYDIVEIVKKTHGVNYDDFNWIRFAGENLNWSDVKLR